jgi:dethiobiotin synthetase
MGRERVGFTNRAGDYRIKRKGAFRGCFSPGIRIWGPSDSSTDGCGGDGPAEIVAYGARFAGAGDGHTCGLAKLEKAAERSGCGGSCDGPRMRHHFFVTGTDTAVGKTTLSALLCAALDAMYWKPIQTGTLEGSDRATVMRLAGIGTDRTIDEVYKFVPPVSPDLAARWAGVEIDLAKINLPNHLANDWLIVEGAGGVLVPINQKQFILDMMVKLKLPVILAARSTLGTINHTLLTLAALHAAELPVHGVVLIGDQNRENRETVERFGHVRVIGEVPRLPNLHRTSLMQVFMNHFDRSAFSQ